MSNFSNILVLRKRNKDKTTEKLTIRVSGMGTEEAYPFFHKNLTEEKNLSIRTRSVGLDLVMKKTQKK